MKILVRGGGDLATGIAIRLYKAGHSIMITEIEVPLTVRRLVAFSRAVYEGTAEIEDIICRRVEAIEEAEEILNRGEIPLLIDPEASIRKSWKPDVVVDAILAKCNLGTSREDADLVIGVGPGFFAGEDVHCVVETKRGPHLGQAIWSGSAIPNTGIPGNVEGYTIERLIKASGDGTFYPVSKIGDFVEKDQIVAYVDKEPVFAKMSGCVRGMLQEGVPVYKGLKVGDIDARLDRGLCVLVSDKARAIGGGVLEAVSAFEHGCRWNGK